MSPIAPIAVTVSVAVAWLFDGSVSGWSTSARTAVLSIVPASVAVTSSVSVALAPAATSPTVHVPPA